MDVLARIVSRPQAKPYRTKKLNETQQISLDKNGLLQWSQRDIENPKEWSKARRWYITLACIVLVMNASMSSSAPSACLEGITEEFGVSDTVGRLTVTLFVLGFCSGPCLWAPLSEYYGRRPIFVGTFICFFAFNFLCAFTPNIAGLLVARFLCGTLVSGALSNTPGIFADLWGPIERGNSMTLFVGALQMGPAIGPITAGFYQLTLNWRWIFYQLTWISAFSLCLLPTIPETLPSRALAKKARRIRKAQISSLENVKAPIEVENRSLLSIFKTSLIRPWAILIDPIAILLAIYLTVVYTLLYMLFTIFPIAFIQIRGWNAGVGEVPLVSVIIGSFLGCTYVFWDSARQRKKIAAGHKNCPEDALPVAMTGAVLFPVGLFWFAWTAQYASIHWIVPVLGAVIFSVSLMILFVGFSSYLSETYLQYAASAQAGNQIVRSLVAATAPLWTQQMFTALGVGGGGSLIGGMAVLLMPISFVFYRYGAKIRAKSRFAPTEPEPVQDSGPDINAPDHGIPKDEEARAVAQEEKEEPLSDSDSMANDARFHSSSDIEKAEASAK
ncbi:Major facilitator superfamily multidrug transporter mdrA [Pseudocercospora fuligena]|uniref:Cercosporin MFS transporter CTB4 n=1 Tax=Pseudocercospora fuligena TaxID=685502 RepID=A0A8H6RQV7_9PEZI|nr:Major facilitator superfamily multidrug transporter mdrA [Pseudocercospora fuligena]